MIQGQPCRVKRPSSCGERQLLEFFAARGWRPLPVQRAAWAAYGVGESGLVHAPTGLGKTLAVSGGPLIDAVNRSDPSPEPPDLRMLWLTPMRALASDTRIALEDPVSALGLPWTVGVRTGDTPASERRRQRQRLPTVLVITPESLALLMTHPGGLGRFSGLEAVVVDEWHELMGSKRGVMTELLLARLRTIQPSARVWGLSATLGNVDAAMTALLGPRNGAGRLIRDASASPIRITSVMPDLMDRFPWAGHLGINLLEGVLDAIDGCRSTLVFTNTRAQAEQWFQAIVTARPQWAPCLGLHHGSVSREARTAVEAGLSAGRLKAVVCTSSLDLGVDFSPVDQVVQIGSPKGIARFMQRAGRSGHQPGKESLVRFVPSHAFELIEIAAVRKALEAERLESRPPLTGSLDVLAQHMVTLAMGDGFTACGLFEEIRGTAAYRKLSREAFDWTLGVVTDGGDALAAYPDYRRLKCVDGCYRMTDRRLSSRHRMNIGTISEDSAVRVQYRNGRRLGTVEESFAARLKPGGRFIFSGKSLQVVRFRDAILVVRKARASGGVVPRWQGGRMPLSTDLAEGVRAIFDGIVSGGTGGRELAALSPVLGLQSRWSALPAAHELLVEAVSTREGQHLFVFPFEGRRVHEGLAALLAYRLARIRP
ncbi:MAG: DEAD/DEAH box helicase, partial [Desulfobacterales bacterium]